MGIKRGAMMNKSRSGIVARTVMAMSMAALLGGCGAATQQVKDVQPVGTFVPQPSLLKPGQKGQADLVYFNPAVNLASYNSFILPPVTLIASPDSEVGKLPPAQQQAMVNSFHEKLYKVLSARCQEAKGPKPGAFVLNVALVDPQASNATMRTISTYVPQAHLVNTLTSYAFNNGVSRWAGDATAEGYATDSVKGTLLWQGVDKRAGADALGKDTFNSWSDVDDASTAWAQQLATKLNQLGMCS
jgi:hypothetical protein